jgi:hypothetical protein
MCLRLTVTGKLLWVLYSSRRKEGGRLEMLAYLELLKVHSIVVGFHGSNVVRLVDIFLGRLTA